MGENENTGQTHATIVALGGGVSCGWVIEGSDKGGWVNWDDED